MTEIEKLYENAGIKCLHPSGFCKHIGDICERCERHKYPPFTAEKQLALIKWLAIKGDFDAFVDIAKNTYNYWTIYFGGGRWTADGFEETLAGLINQLWQDLTEKEKSEIKEILSE